jgi:hypothetical protein
MQEELFPALRTFPWVKTKLRQEAFFEKTNARHADESLLPATRAAFSSKTQWTYLLHRLRMVKQWKPAQNERLNPFLYRKFLFEESIG